MVDGFYLKSSFVVEIQVNEIKAPILGPLDLLYKLMKLDTIIWSPSPFPWSLGLGSTLPTQVLFWEHLKISWEVSMSAAKVVVVACLSCEG